MKFLIVIPEGMFTNTSSSIFSYNFVSELSKSHIVDIIGYSLPENYLFNCNIKNINIRSYIYLESDLILKYSPKKQKIKSTPYENKSSKVQFLLKLLIKRVLPDYMALGLLDIKNIKNIEIDNDYDYILSLSDPKSAHFLAVFLKNKFNELKSTELIQFWGDPWYHDITRDTGFLDKKIESWLLKRADLVFYRSQPTLNLQAKTYPEHSNKFAFIHRGFSGGKVSNFESQTLIKNACFVYAGDFHPHIRNLENFCLSASQFGHSVHLIGSTSQSFIDKTKDIPNIRISTRVTPEELRQIYDESDCLIIVMNKTGSQIPGKTYDLIPEKKPIIVLMDGAITKSDLPNPNRYIFIKNTVEDINNFFLETKQIHLQLNEEYNQLHISNIVRLFVNSLKNEIKNV